MWSGGGAFKGQVGTCALHSESLGSGDAVCILGDSSLLLHPRLQGFLVVVTPLVLHFYAGTDLSGKLL